jgi:hypothetical protein
MSVSGSAKSPEGTMTKKQLILVCQVITVAMAMGMILFNAVSAFMAFNGVRPPQNIGGPIPFVLVCGVAPVLGLVAMLTMRQIMQAILIGQLRTSDKATWSARIIQGYQQHMLIGHALCEGAGLLTSVGFLITHEWWLLASVGLALAGILLRFPTTTGFEAWKKQLTETAEA